MNGSASDHQSFLLHIWQEGNQKQPVWRASITFVESGKRMGFSGPLPALIYLLHMWVQRHADGSSTHGASLW